MKSVKAIGVVISGIFSIFCWLISACFALCLIGMMLPHEENILTRVFGIFQYPLFNDLFKAVGITVTDGSGWPADNMYEIKFIMGILTFACLAVFFLFVFQSFRKSYGEGKTTIYSSKKLKDAGIILLFIPVMKLLAFIVAYVAYDKYVQFVNEEGFIVYINLNPLTIVVIIAALVTLAVSIFVKKSAEMEEDMEGLI